MRAGIKATNHQCFFFSLQGTGGPSVVLDTKGLCGLTLFDLWSNIVCPFSHWTFCVTNTMLDEKVWLFSQNFRDSTLFWSFILFYIVSWANNGSRLNAAGQATFTLSSQFLPLSSSCLNCFSISLGSCHFGNPTSWGAFHSTKNTGLKFCTFQLANETVLSSCSNFLQS